VYASPPLVRAGQCGSGGQGVGCDNLAPKQHEHSPKHMRKEAPVPPEIGRLQWGS